MFEGILCGVLEFFSYKLTLIIYIFPYYKLHVFS